MCDICGTSYQFSFSTNQLNVRLNRTALHLKSIVVMSDVVHEKVLVQRYGELLLGLSTGSHFSSAFAHLLSLCFVCFSALLALFSSSSPLLPFTGPCAYLPLSLRTPSSLISHAPTVLTPCL
jgi:hypothetical protein